MLVFILDFVFAPSHACVVRMYVRMHVFIGQWDCVITCFFMDTAPVVVKYVETIYSALRPGGYW